MCKVAYDIANQKQGFGLFPWSSFQHLQVLQTGEQASVCGRAEECKENTDEISRGNRFQSLKWNSYSRIPCGSEKDVLRSPVLANTQSFQPVFPSILRVRRNGRVGVLLVVVSSSSLLLLLGWWWWWYIFLQLMLNVPQLCRSDFELSILWHKRQNWH